jgi:hypothetical protein
MPDESVQSSPELDATQIPRQVHTITPAEPPVPEPETPVVPKEPPKKLLGQFDSEEALAEYVSERNAKLARYEQDQEHQALEQQKARRKQEEQVFYQRQLQKDAEIADKFEELLVAKDKAGAFKTLREHIIQEALPVMAGMLQQHTAAQSMPFQVRDAFLATPELEDIHDLAPQAVLLHSMGMDPKHIPDFLRSTRSIKASEKTGTQTELPAPRRRGVHLEPVSAAAPSGSADEDNKIEDKAFLAWFNR